ncbi:hypothetical protein ACQ46_gp040 [Citrobacter phage Moon]|uniref:Uncharacterized protein n=1 Tax=Citrobacter phage Moon TaxID=1540095 RepID=A0A0A0YQ07_9CAUD|nr:hypothetical protein ACQ46_gp040 [Citrobacter phage Moon]AIX12011.1 hypothetical protein CPT_Moon40 [Citrobacter phage Moon]
MNKTLFEALKMAVSRGLNESKVTSDIRPGKIVKLIEGKRCSAWGEVGVYLRAESSVVVVSEVFIDKIDGAPSVLVGTHTESDFRIVRANNLKLVENATKSDFRINRTNNFKVLD